MELTREQELNNLYAELALREVAKRQYKEYLPYVHGKAWKRTKMSAFIADEVQRFIEQKTSNAYDILVIETPPQHGKSMTLTESLPSWYLGKHPEDRVLLASYNEDFAGRFCRRNREKLKAVGADLFGVSIGAISRADEFELDNGRGRLISRGIMSGITGNPANLVIIDDPIKNREEADSPTKREKLWEEWQNSVKSRLAAHGKVIIIMTPWHEDDFAARILANEPNSRLLRLPIEAEVNDPLGRKPGEPLCPELGKDKKWLEDFKASYINDPQGGQRAWAALYQCSPRVESGNLVHRDWWRFYDPDETRLYGSMLVSVDAAFKDKDTSDYVSIQVWGKHLKDYYLLYCMNKHLNFLATCQSIKMVQGLYPQAQMVLIEDKANGSAIIQTLSRQGVWCIPVNPSGGKVARVNAVSAAIESGHVYLPDMQKAPWVADYVDQFTAFPNGAHDDMVDATSQALNRLIFYTGEYEKPKLTEDEMMAMKEQKEFLDTDSLFNPYGVKEEYNNSYEEALQI